MENSSLSESSLDLIRYGALYAPSEWLERLIGALPLNERGILSLLSKCLCGEKIDVIRKKSILDALAAAGLDLSALPVNNGREIISGEIFRKLYGSPMLFTVSGRITSRYSESEIRMNIAVLYKLMRSRPIKDINQINAALEIMLCREHDENFNLDELSRVYNINGEKLKEIISLLDGSNDINEQTD